jgi:hypothetical protein
MYVTFFVVVQGFGEENEDEVVEAEEYGAVDSENEEAEVDEDVAAGAVGESAVYDVFLMGSPFHITYAGPTKALLRKWKRMGVVKW